MLLLLLNILLDGVLSAQSTPPVPEHVRLFHFNSVVADAHNDVLQRILAGEDILKRTTKGHSDLPRFKDGGIDIQVFSIWVPPGNKSKAYFSQANEQIDSIESVVRRSNGQVVLVRDFKQISAALAENRFIAMLGMEGSHPIGGDLSKLDHFFNRGVRYITITWNNSTEWASSAQDESARSSLSKKKGLTQFGRKAIGRMNDLGIIVDVSHVGERTFWDIIKTSTKPVIASHSSVWKLCPHRRNLKDDQLVAIAKTGGVVFINFLPDFIDSTFSIKDRRLRALHQKWSDSLRIAWKGNQSTLDSTISAIFEKNHQMIRPPLSKLVDHFDYAIKLMGVEHVGIGSDFDGINTTPLEMDDVTFLPKLTEALLDRGYLQADVRKVLGENFLRVVSEVCR